MIEMKIPVATAKTANRCLEGKEFAQEIGFPLVIRPSFTLGGTGGGFVHDKDELDEALNRGYCAQPCMGDLSTQPCRVAVERRLTLVRLRPGAGETPPCAAMFRNPTAFGPAISDPVWHPAGHMEAGSWLSLKR